MATAQFTLISIGFYIGGSLVSKTGMTLPNITDK